MNGKKSAESTNILILGLGGVGYYLTKRLSHDGHAITAVELDRALIKRADGEADALMARIEAIRDFLLARGRLTASFTGSDAAYEKSRSALLEWIEAMKQYQPYGESERLISKDAVMLGAEDTVQEAGAEILYHHALADAIVEDACDRHERGLRDGR